MSCEEIGVRIKNLREQAGLTQADLAKEMHVSREAVNQWERGARDLKSGTIVDIAQFFDVSCDYLLRGIEARNLPINDELGLSNSSIAHLRYLTEVARTGEPDEYDELRAIDGLLSSTYRSILFDVYEFFTTDFNNPYILTSPHAKTEEEAFTPQNNYMIAFRKESSSEQLTDELTHCFMEIDGDVYENAYLSRITNRMKMLKLCHGSIPLHNNNGGK